MTHSHHSFLVHQYIASLSINAPLMHRLFIFFIFMPLLYTLQPLLLLAFLIYAPFWHTTCFIGLNSHAR